MISLNNTKNEKQEQDRTLGMYKQIKRKRISRHIHVLPSGRKLKIILDDNLSEKERGEQ